MLHGREGLQPPERVVCLLQLFLLLSASQAFLLNLCIFWCTTVNSPLATTVTGAPMCLPQYVCQEADSDPDLC